MSYSRTVVLYSRTVVLWCDARDPLPSGQDFGCYAEFKPPAEMRFAPLAKVRRAAKEAGWAYVRDPGSIRALDKDLCPKHNPAPPSGSSEGVPTEKGRR